MAVAFDAKTVTPVFAYPQNPVNVVHSFKLNETQNHIQAVDKR